MPALGIRELEDGTRTMLTSRTMQTSRETMISRASEPANGRLRTTSLRVAPALACLLLAGALSGCGGFDGVELNGKIFEAVGLSGDSFGKKSEPKTEARAPLVLPPDTKRLPEPGDGQPAYVQAPAGQIVTGSIGADPASWPKDREKMKQAEAAEKARAKDITCNKDGNWKEKATKDERALSAEANCQGSLFSVIGKNLFGTGE